MPSLYYLQRAATATNYRTGHWESVFRVLFPPKKILGVQSSLPATFGSVGHCLRPSRQGCLRSQPEPMDKRRILIVDNNDELRARLERVLVELGCEVVATGDRGQALARDDLDDFDLIISDLTENADSEAEKISTLQRKRLITPLAPNGRAQAEIVKAFKLGAANFLRLPFNCDELREIVEQTLSYKAQFVDDPTLLAQAHEMIEFELPSDLSLMNGVLQYLLERVSKLGIVKPERSNLFIALDEAFVNAVRHGNKNDPTKLLRVTAELSPREACFTVEDEGSGFDVREIPDPCDPANLFKTSGRGVLLIYNIMDEVEYNTQGNRVKMVKRPEQ
jgi:serine/threonine-protein kinase RsbW